MNPTTRLYIYTASGRGGHQSGHQLVTPHCLMTFPFSPSPSNSNPNPSSPREAPSTCSSLNKASPTPCVELRSLPVPRGRGVGRPSVDGRVIDGRISIDGGKEGLMEEGDISTGLDVGWQGDESGCSRKIGRGWQTYISSGR